MINKISIVGAGGVGSTLGFTLLNRLAISELVMIDIASGLAEGLALDFEDCRGSLGFSTKINGSSNLSDLKDSDIVVITAGIARKKGMSRIDLLKINSQVAKDVASQVKKFSPQAIVIAVTNPLDIITYLVAKETKFPRQRIIGMGSSLDTSRLFNIIHNLTGVNTSSIGGFVYGQHSKDMIVEPKRITVGEKSFESLVDEKEAKAVVERVQLRGAEIVGFLKNGSARFGPAAACCRLIEAISDDKNELIPVSVLLEGEYGLNDICLGLPCIINGQGIAKVVEMDLSPQEKAALTKAEEVFKQCMI